MTQSIQAFRLGLFNSCTAAYAGERDSTGKKVLVSYGPPGTHQPFYIVAVGMECRQAVSRPTLGPRRSRERAVELDVMVSCYAAGTGEAAQPIVADACDHLVDVLETFLRTSPNETLGGACRDSWVSAIDGPRLDLAVNPKSGAPTGRIAEATATVTALIRY